MTREDMEAERDNAADRRMRERRDDEIRARRPGKQPWNPYGWCGCTCGTNGPGEHAADCPAGAS